MCAKKLSDKEIRAAAVIIARRLAPNFDEAAKQYGVPSRTLQSWAYEDVMPSIKAARTLVGAAGGATPPQEMEDAPVGRGGSMSEIDDIRDRALQIVKRVGSTSVIQAKLAAIGVRMAESSIRNWTQEGRRPQLERAREVLRAFGESDGVARGKLENPPEGAESWRSTPIVGTVAASANGTIGEVVTMNGSPVATVVEQNQLFRLEVIDESMIPLARPGQHVLVDTGLQVRSGDLAVVDIAKGEDEPSLVFKRVRIAGGKWSLESVMPGVKPIELTHPPRAMYAVSAILVRV